jgi:hypothetical protein
VLPRVGDLRLDQVTYSVIEDFKIELVKTPINVGLNHLAFLQ